MKWLPLIVVLLATTSCTTLENRRDLYRSPEEGYERNYPNPPPTRLPASGPVPATARNTTPSQSGPPSYPEEGLPTGGH